MLSRFQQKINMSTALLSALPFPVCELCKRNDDVVKNSTSFNLSARTSDTTQASWNPSCLCLFTKLPDKYLVGFIFPFLDIDSLVKCSQTCTRWRALSEDPILYKNLHVDSLKTEAEAKAFKVISRRRVGDLVETLKVKVGGASQDASRLSTSTFSARLSRLSALSFLGSKSKTNANDVTSFIVAHPTLRRLILDGVTSIRDEHIKDILNGLKGGGGLRQLSVNQCRGLTDDFLNCLTNSDSAQTLEILSFEGCVQFSSSNLIAFLRAGGGRNLRRLYARGIRGSDDTLCNVLSTCCPYLEELDISNENPFGTSSEYSITDKGLYSLASSLGDTLRTLRIQGHVQITDAGLASSLSMLPLIEVIDTRGCRLVGDLSASALSDSKDRKGLLREVRFFGSSLTDDGLQMLSSVLCRDPSTIEIVDLFGCKKITFEGVKTFVESLSISLSNNKVRPNTTICLGGIRCLQFPTVKADLLSRSSSSMKILFN